MKTNNKVVKLARIKKSKSSYMVIANLQDALEYAKSNYVTGCTVSFSKPDRTISKRKQVFSVVKEDIHSVTNLCEVLEQNYEDLQKILDKLYDER